VSKSNKQSPIQLIISSPPPSKQTAKKTKGTAIDTEFIIFFIDQEIKKGKIKTPWQEEDMCML
jgi:hypothetical protein